MQAIEMSVGLLIMFTTLRVEIIIVLFRRIMAILAVITVEFIAIALGSRHIIIMLDCTGIKIIRILGEMEQNSIGFELVLVLIIILSLILTLTLCP